MAVSTRGGLLVLACYLLVGGSPSPQVGRCLVEFQALRDGPWQTRFEGSDSRHQLIEQIRGLMDRYDGADVFCEGRLTEYQVFLLLLESRHSEAADVAGRYLDKAGDDADVALRLRILGNKGYALERMGETRESSQAYFAAAALAGQTEAKFGIKALIDASGSANILRDWDAVEMYLDEASRLIADSLVGADQEENLVLVLRNQAALLEDRIELMENGAERQKLIRELKAVTDRALGMIPVESGGLAGNSVRLLGANALALALLGKHDLAQRRAAPINDLAMQSKVLYPSAPFKAWEYQSRIAEARGDITTALEATWEARQEAIRLGDGLSERTMIHRLGHLAEVAGKWREAAERYTEAIVHEEAHREQLGLQDWTAQAFGYVEAAYRGLVRSQLALGDHEAAFGTLDHTRARYLRDLRRHLDVRNRLTPARHQKADSLQTALEEARLLLLGNELSGADRARVTFRISTLQESLDTLIGSSAEPAPEFDIEALQTKLAQQDQVLVSYFLDPRVSTAFIVRPDTLMVVPLTTSPEAVETILRKVGNPWDANDSTADPAFRLDALHFLYREVMAPLLPWIEGTSSLVFIPDYPLGGVPFGMLTTKPSDNYATAPYLIRRFSIATELAASMVSEPRPDVESPNTQLDLLAFGRTNFESTGFTWNAAERLSDLPYVDEEIKGVGKRIRMRQVALNDEATEGELNRLVTKAKIIHIASHAESDPELPLYSKIALWDGPEDDGILYLYELQSQPLVAELVVLSGCSTARGRIQNGEGMIGLQYAVRTAGAHASLATLWPVDDEASVMLMTAFYDGLKEGLTKDRALQRAQLTYLDNHAGLRASPFFWAGPVLSGDTTPISLDLTNPTEWWVGLGLVLACCGVAWHLRRRRRLDA